ncbi:hypothetical protein DFH09DRAFT_1096283 [Mycena vulgaris]|nr:hypothetical protein DFH09DRAFT_1096283 [Mycena vulgaris]
MEVLLQYYLRLNEKYKVSSLRFPRNTPEGLLKLRRKVQKFAAVIGATVTQSNYCGKYSSIDSGIGWGGDVRGGSDTNELQELGKDNYSRRRVGAAPSVGQWSRKRPHRERLCVAPRELNRLSVHLGLAVISGGRRAGNPPGFNKSISGGTHRAHALRTSSASWPADDSASRDQSLVNGSFPLARLHSTEGGPEYVDRSLGSVLRREEERDPDGDQRRSAYTPLERAGVITVGRWLPSVKLTRMQ